MPGRLTVGQRTLNPFIMVRIHAGQHMTNYTPFLDNFFAEITRVGIDISNLKLDHIAYQAATSAEYENLLPEFSQLGELVNQEIIGERRVAIIELKTPLIYKNYTIPALELIEPKKGQQCDSAFQHAEFVMEETFEKYMAKYPAIHWDTSSMNRSEFAHLKLNFESGLTLKFLHKPILELVKH